MIKSIHFSLFILFIFPFILRAQTYPEVVFDNSIVSGSYAKSNVEYTGDSWVQNINKNLPVVDSVYFTPGNALSLRYISNPNGMWKASVLYAKQRSNTIINTSDVLTFRINIFSGATPESLPQIVLKQGDTETAPVRLKNYIGDWVQDTWLSISVPVSKFDKFQEGKAISAVTFIQNQPTKEVAQVFIDQIEFLPKTYSKVKLSSAAILSNVIASNNQVELSWLLPLTPSIRYVKVYRSEDNKKFIPVSMFPVFMNKGLDRVPNPNATYYYKIAWVDYNYVESPFSAVKEVKTQYSSDDKLVQMIKNNYLNYFVDNFDINSGMYMPDAATREVVVSTGETGSAVLALIAGIENKNISRQAAFNRISKMVNFLGKVSHHNGMFTYFYNGRTGKPIFRNNKEVYSVKATATLIEALLVARQYFKGEDIDEKMFRESVDALWKRADWASFTKFDNPNVLNDKSMSNDSLVQSYPLFGFNDNMNTYILAMASPTHPIPATAFEEGWAVQQPLTGLTGEGNTLTAIPLDSALNKSMRLNIPVGMDSLSGKSVFHSQRTAYGVHFPLGELNQSLIGVLRAFTTINPHGKYYKGIALDKILQANILVHKRKDNEANLFTRYTDVWGVDADRRNAQSVYVNPAISLATYPFEKEIATKAMNKLYDEYGDVAFTIYGFRGWIDLQNNDVSEFYDAKSQSVVALMLENAKNGLIWNLYDSIPEIKSVTDKLFKQSAN